MLFGKRARRRLAAAARHNDTVLAELHVVRFEDGRRVAVIWPVDAGDLQGVKDWADAWNKNPKPSALSSGDVVRVVTGQPPIT